MIKTEQSNIRRMQLDDVEAVVLVHLKAFQKFFLTFLGPAFLREFYKSVLVDASGIAFVFSRNSQILGFVVGTDQPSGFYRRLLYRRWWRFGLALLLPLIKRPRIITKILYALKSPHQFHAPTNSAILMSIAVAPEAQGTGAGQSLVRAFLSEASRRDLNQVVLTTDKHNNDRANRFYRKLGFMALDTFVTDGAREMIEYSIEFNFNKLHHETLTISSYQVIAE